MNSSLPFASEAASAVRKVSDFIHDNPELGYKEFQASAKLKELLRSWGFRIEENVCGLETAFKAYWESGRMTKTSRSSASWENMMLWRGSGTAAGTT